MASPPKPQQASRTNSRRVRVGREWGIGSGDMEEPVQVEHGQGELFGRLVAEEVERQVPLLGGRRSAEGEPEGPIDQAAPVAARLGFEPAGERRGEVVREAAVEQL